MVARRTLCTALFAVVAPTLVGGAISRLGADPAGIAIATKTTEPAARPDPTTTANTIDPGVVRGPGRAVTRTTSPPPATIPADLDRIAVWYRLADCETGVWTTGKVPVPGSARWDVVSRGYQGGLQFHPSTWDRNKRAGDPEDAQAATPAQQIAVGEIVLARQGAKAWPTCGPRIGLQTLLVATPTAPDDGFPAGDPTVVYEGSSGDTPP